jgi:hypothetical protein
MIGRAPWLALALAACASQPQPEPRTEPRNERSEATAMNQTNEATHDPLRAFDRHPTATVTIRYGTEHFGKGEVTLAVRGDGAVRVDQRIAGAVNHHEAQLDGARVAALGRTLAEHHFTSPRTSSLPREPGDTPLVLRLSGAGTPAFETTIWYADRFKDRDLDAILRVTDDVLYAASDGKLGQSAQ